VHAGAQDKGEAGMDPDLLLSIGVVIGVLTLPSFVSAWREGRAPRVGAVLLMVAGVLIVTAVLRKPGGYTLTEIPGTVIAAFGRYLH